MKHDQNWYIRDELVECLRLAMLQWKRNAAQTPSDINPAMWSRCTQALADAQSKIKLAGEH